MVKKWSKTGYFPVFDHFLTGASQEWLKNDPFWAIWALKLRYRTAKMAQKRPKGLKNRSQIWTDREKGVKKGSKAGPKIVDISTRIGQNLPKPEKRAQKPVPNLVRP